MRAHERGVERTIGAFMIAGHSNGWLRSGVVSRPGGPDGYSWSSGGVFSGSVVALLPNGNFVVTDPGYSTAGIFLCRRCLSVLRSLSWATAIKLLWSHWSNGAAVNAGSVTWANGNTDLSGGFREQFLGRSASQRLGWVLRHHRVAQWQLCRPQQWMEQRNSHCGCRNLAKPKRSGAGCRLCGKFAGWDYAIRCGWFWRCGCITWVTRLSPARSGTTTV